MSKELICRCDECGTVKGETNHWWAVMNHPTQPRFSTATEADLEEVRATFRLDYCGQYCVTTVFNRWLSTGTVLKPVASMEKLTEAAPVGDWVAEEGRSEALTSTWATEEELPGDGLVKASCQLVDDAHPLARLTRLDMRDPVNDVEKWPVTKEED